MAKPFFCHTNLGICMVKQRVSVSDLAFDTRINPRYLGYYLKGEKQMTPDHLRKIAQALDVDPRDIFQPLQILVDITPHQDHRAAVRANNEFRPFPQREPDLA
jgi:transcriptional regulator with XRE-family HTH domain